VRFDQKRDPSRLQHDQSNDGGHNTSQELAGSKAESIPSVTLSASRTRRTGRAGGRRSRDLGGSRGRGRNETGEARARGTDWKRAGSTDLRLFSGSKLSAHSGQLELGGEGQRRISGIRGILEAERLEPDEVLVRVGSDGRVRSELERGDVGNIGRGRKLLEGGLLLRVSDVDGDLSETEVHQCRRGIARIAHPRNVVGLTSWPRGASNWRRGVKGSKS